MQVLDNNKQWTAEKRSQIRPLTTVDDILAYYSERKPKRVMKNPVIYKAPSAR